MKKNMLTLTLLSMLAMTVAGCGNKEQLSDSNTSTNTSDQGNFGWSHEQKLDEFGVLPEEVRNAQISIDFLEYIEGQNGTMPDIGNYTTDPNDPTYRYHPQDVNYIEAAQYVAAAQAFKELCPGVQINLIYCSIDEYNNTIRDYRNQKGHLPHLMHGADTAVAMLTNGYNHDVSEYSDSAYYDQYNDYLMSRFNFGGFQAAFPIALDPWGIIVNVTDLETNNIIEQAVDPDTLLPTEEYKEWVDNFTWDVFMDSCRKIYDEGKKKAGVSKVDNKLISYSVPSIYKQFIEEGTVDLTSQEVRTTIEKLLTYENELANYSVYSYDSTLNYNEFGNKAKTTFDNAANWKGSENFLQDKYCTFFSEAPWVYDLLSTRIDSINEEADKGQGERITDRFDYIPFPKLNAEDEALNGIAVGSLQVGEQCPVGNDEPCTDKKRLEMEVAAYFAMFMALDPRSIEARSKVEYYFDNQHFVGDAALPISKHGARFAWQDNPDLAELDPAKDYDDNWEYQMANWFKVFKMYTTDKNEADVTNFTNVMPGLVKLFDSIFAIPGQGEDYVTCLNYVNEPVLVPSSSTDVDGNDGTTSSTRNFFEGWDERYTKYGDGNNIGRLGTDTYVSNVMAQLETIQNDINENSAKAWNYLQECVEQYYDVNYDCSDHSTRNNYQGHKPL